MAPSTPSRTSATAPVGASVAVGLRRPVYLEATAFLATLARRSQGLEPNAPLAVLDGPPPDGRILVAENLAIPATTLVGRRWSQMAGSLGGVPSVVLSAEERWRVLADLAAALGAWTPRLLVSPDLGGGVWLEGAGVVGWYPDEASWLREIARTAQRQGWRVRLGIGDTPAGALAAARTGVGRFPDPGAERRAWRALPLDALPGLAEPERRALAAAGITTLGAWAAAGAAELTMVTEVDVALREQLLGHRPLVGLRPPSTGPVRIEHRWELPLPERSRILFELRPELTTLVEAARARGEGIAQFTIHLDDGSGGRARRRIVCHEPLQEARELLRLLGIFLERVHGDAIRRPPLVLRLELTFHEYLAQQPLLLDLDAPSREPVPAPQPSTSHPRSSRRFRERGEAALRRLVAELGRERVGCWLPAPGLLPERRRRFVPRTYLTSPRPTPASVPPPVPHRWSLRSRPLAAPPDPGAWCGAPWLVEGGWWHRRLRRWYRYRWSGERLELCYQDRHGRWWHHGWLG